MLWLLFIWLLLCTFVGAIGQNRTCGFAGPFFASLLLSPVIGLIIALCYPTKARAEERQAIVKVAQGSRVDQLERLGRLKDEGKLTQEEYEAEKRKLA